MIGILFQLFLIYLVIMFIKNIMDMKKFNKDSSLVILEDFKIEPNKRIMDPLFIKYKMDNINLKEFINNNLLNHYCNNNICIRLSDFNTFNDLNIYNNNKLIDDLKLKSISESIIEKFKNMFSFNNKYSCSLFRGINSTNINKNVNNIYIIGCVLGKCNIYLYNPKHNDILKDENIKKYSIKVELKEDNLLYIPTEWHYNIETENDCILTHIRSDTYFTSLYNEYRN